MLKATGVTVYMKPCGALIEILSGTAILSSQVAVRVAVMFSLEVVVTVLGVRPMLYRGVACWLHTADVGDVKVGPLGPSDCIPAAYTTRLVQSDSRPQSLLHESVLPKAILT